MKKITVSYTSFFEWTVVFPTRIRTHNNANYYALTEQREKYTKICHLEAYDSSLLMRGNFKIVAKNLPLLF